MALRDDLRPTGKNRVIDLVQASGLDVSDWSSSKQGASFAARNPKYCYNWSFTGPNGLVILNLWYKNIEEKRGTVFSTANLRSIAHEMRVRGSHSLQISRAKAMDRALQLAFEQNLPVRVIINDGEMGVIENPARRVSKVDTRMLDPMPWTVTAYNFRSGVCSLKRGVRAIETVDQFSLPEIPDGPTERFDVDGQAFKRSLQVREAVWKRANGRCEYCDELGFRMSNGKYFLETHHIIPLSRDGADNVSNVAAVCANHHREAHYGECANQIRDQLLEIVSLKLRKMVNRKQR